LGKTRRHPIENAAKLGDLVGAANMGADIQLTGRESARRALHVVQPVDDQPMQGDPDSKAGGQDNQTAGYPQYQDTGQRLLLDTGGIIVDDQ
jgi:hypothetical protein